MKFLIDTNIVIPLEPTSVTDFEVNTKMALNFRVKAEATGQTLFIHPYTSYDIERDKNPERREVRKQTLGRYQQIPSIPPLSSRVVELWNPAPYTNDWVDIHLLDVLYRNACDYLVSEDRGLHQKAGTVGIGARVLYLADALQILVELFPTQYPPPFPHVKHPFCYELDFNDPIFASIRQDYGNAGFDTWFNEKCCRGHRTAFVIESDNRIAGLCIHNIQDQVDSTSLIGKALKLCTFKVGEEYSGFRFGELLLKAALGYAYEKKVKYVFMTVYPKHDQLLHFCDMFGFENVGNKGEEQIRCKTLLNPGEIPPTANLDSLKAHVLYGPRYFLPNQQRIFLVPIQPRYHKLLYPESEDQFDFGISMSPPCGNCLRKAYLCHANTNQITAGDLLLFYRSADLKSVTNVAVVEDTLRSDEPEELARFVSKRTVYTYDDIVGMCEKNVLAIKYRDAWALQTPVKYSFLNQHGLLRGVPQSIVQLQEKEGNQWLLEQIAQ